MGIIRIDSLPVAAYLLTQGHPLAHLTPDPKRARRFRFFFAGGPRLVQDLREFFAHTALVDPCRFVECMVELKQLIRTRQRRQAA